jgi:hypothetical protein
VRGLRRPVRGLSGPVLRLRGLDGCLSRPCAGRSWLGGSFYTYTRERTAGVFREGGSLLGRERGEGGRSRMGRRICGGRFARLKFVAGQSGHLP